MSDYLFTGAYPRVLAGLSQGVNALLTPADGDAPPYGSTVEAAHGDHVHTDEPYLHPELEETSDSRGLSPEDEAWAQANPAPAPTEATPIPAPVDPAPAAEPAPDTTTAEGAPAPATTN
ncbi:hypothetical protein ACFFGR_09175 [Arthrobacter liuii]|uniref:Uncharacterized protein n=1 Tax=Arthrobacter liuii TaxID=1476996 RepID=A0ABQ2ALT6_9MICC|nr:hypothetical protein [Arthrobacter liuii]GGH93748.1 hypothetical protein GCM10007170_15340 [Arthrobacter liuii]